MLMSASGCGVDSSLKTSGIGRDLALVTWVGTGGPGPVEQAAEEAYASIDAALRERGCVPVQERAFGDLQAAPGLARGRARAVGTRPRSGPCRPPTWRDRRSAAPASRASTWSGRAGAPASWPRATGCTDGSWRERRRACVGLADVGRRVPGRLAVGPAEDAAAPSTRRKSCWPARASPSATWRARGSTCGTSWTGTAPSTPCATPPSGGWGSWDRAATARSRPAPGSRGATRAAAGARSTCWRCSRRAAAARRCSGCTTASRTRRPSTARPSPGRWRSSSATRATSSSPARPRSTTTARPCTWATSRRRRATRSRRWRRCSRAPARASRTCARPRPSSRTPATAAPSSASSSGRACAAAPLVTTVADVCRDDLLFEIDAVAVVPLGRGARR